MIQNGSSLLIVVEVRKVERRAEDRGFPVCVVISSSFLRASISKLQINTCIGLHKRRGAGTDLDQCGVGLIM